MRRVFVLGLAGATLVPCFPAVTAGCAPFPERGATFTLGVLGGGSADLPPVKLTGGFPTLAAAQQATAPAEAALDAAPDPAHPDVRGQVLGLVGGQPVPLADALVSTSDGRSARTAASGRFLLVGDPPKDGAYVVAHAGFVASGAMGLMDRSGLAFHLLPQADPRPNAAAADVPFAVTGRVLDPSGAAATGVFVTFADAAGAFAAPALTDAGGNFTLQLYAAGQAVTAGTLLAAGPSGLGLATGLAASPARAALAPLTLVAAGRPLHVQPTGAPGGAVVRTTVSLTAADGSALVLPASGDAVMLGDVPGGRFSLLAEAVDADAGTDQVIYRDALDAGAGTWQGAFLGVPSLSPTGLLLNGELAWGAVNGASAYEVRVSQPDEAGLIWEALATQTHLPLSYQDALAGRLQLSVAAWDTAAADIRTLSSLSGRARIVDALRLPAASHVDFRMARHTVSSGAGVAGP